MSGQKWWSRDLSGMVHPDKSILLAYTRQQSLGEGWQDIYQHINSCQRCRQCCNEYEEINPRLVEALGYLQSNQSYPSLTENVFELIENPAGARLARRRGEQERRKRYLVTGAKRLSFLSFRLAPFTALLLVLLLVAIVVAHPASWLPANHDSGNQISKGGTAASLATVSSHATESPKPHITAKIVLCTTGAEATRSIIRICGSNFMPGDSIELLVQRARSVPASRLKLIVNQQGNFYDSWTVTSCNDYPIAISVTDLTHPAGASTGLSASQLGQCSIPNPTPTTVGHDKGNNPITSTGMNVRKRPLSVICSRCRQL